MGIKVSIIFSPLINYYKIIVEVEHDAKRKEISIPKVGLDSVFKSYLDGVKLPTEHAPDVSITLYINIFL